MEKSTFEKEYLDVKYPMPKKEDFEQYTFAIHHFDEKQIEVIKQRSIATQAYEYAMKEKQKKFPGIDNFKTTTDVR